MEKSTQKKIDKLQLIEQNLGNLSQQKQNIQLQLNEVENAIEELNKSDVSYKIVGPIMVKSSKENLKLELENKEKILNLKIKTIEKQEDQIKEKMKNLQGEIMEEMGGD